MNHKDAEAQRNATVWKRFSMLCALVPLWFAATASAAETKTLLFFGDSGAGMHDGAKERRVHPRMLTDHDIFECGHVCE